MIPQHIIVLYGTPRLDLIGKYYNCLFDETQGKYRIDYPHKHKIEMSWGIDHKGFIWDGMCFELEGGRIIAGCREIDVSDG